MLTVESIMTFGKYKGKQMSHVVRHDPTYITEFLAKIPSVNLSTELVDMAYKQDSANNPIDENTYKTRKRKGSGYYDGEYDDFVNSECEAYMTDMGDR